MWNSNLVSTLSESNSSGSPSNNASMDVISANPEQNVGNKKARTSTSGGGGGGPAATSKRSSNNKSKSKLSRVRYFLHPGEPAVGQIVSDSLTDGQDNNNTLSLKQPQVILRNSYIGPPPPAVAAAETLRRPDGRLVLASHIFGFNCCAN